MKGGLPCRPRALVTGLVALLAVATGPALPTAGQVRGPCTASINGIDAARAATPRGAVEVDAGGEAVLRGRAPRGASTTRIEVEVASRRWTLFEGQNPGGGTWGRTVPVANYSRYGVGWYHLVATTEGCRVEAWIRVVGRPPLTTVLGGGAAALLVVGLVLQSAGLVLGVRRRRGLLLVLFGGLATGLGAKVLAQQVGIVGLGAESLALSTAAVWTVSPSLAAGLVRAALTRARAGGPAAAPVPAPPPPGTASAQPVPAPPPPVTGSARHGPRAASPRASSATVPGYAPAAEIRDPPRSAYGLLQCPEVVVPGYEFELVVGLNPTPIAGVAGPEMVRPASSVGPYVLTVQVVADGFVLRPGESWRRQLPVSYEQPYPTTVLHLEAEPQDSPVRARSLQALYSVDGQTIGLAVRAVAVARTAEIAGQATVPPQDASVAIAIPAGEPAADLTVHIVSPGPDAGGRLLWTFETPHPNMPVPDTGLATDIGTEPAGFARRLIEEIAAHEARGGLAQALRGIGLTIADNMPSEFFPLLDQIARRCGGRPPSVLLLSAEPYIPWELAVCDPPLDANAPPFLAAQAIVGRWVLGQRRPRLPPPTVVPVRTVAVISGVYEGQGWSRLVVAEQEAAELQQTLGAYTVNATSGEVLECIEGQPEAEVLHFAVHGAYDPNSTEDGLVLVDGSTLDPFVVKGARLRGAPFVFLNACQVGSGQRVLGDYAGMAEAFLYAGASGVIAPLWSVNDALAKELALDFYPKVFAGQAPAEVLRNARASFDERSQGVSATHLAYQFFGHPALRLTREVPSPR